MTKQVPFFIAALLFFPLIGNTQDSNGEEREKPEQLERTSSWTELTSEKGVKVQYKYEECRDKKNDIHKENVLLRFENSNDRPVSLEWDHQLWYDGNCRTCGGSEEYHQRIELEAGETLEGDCAASTPQHLQVFAKFLRSGKGRPDTELTGLKLADLQVE